MLVEAWTLGKWIDGWERTVTWIEDDPETLLYDEYPNAVAHRDGVTYALGDDPEAGVIYAPRIGALDRRFKAVTVAVSEPVARRPGRIAWWWYRVPIRPSDQFEEALDAWFPNAAADFKRQRPPGTR